VQIMALTTYLKIEVHITYVSGREGTDGAEAEPVTHRLPEGLEDSTGTSVKLLYRPGHYDLLYPKQTEAV